MLIVPDHDTLLVEARIPPSEIDQVHLGAKAMLRFTSFNQRTTPQIEGELVRMSADISQDQKRDSRITPCGSHYRSGNATVRQGETRARHAR